MHKRGDRGSEAWSLDDVDYKTEVKPESFENREPSGEGVFVHGLMLEGCKWYRTLLEDAEPKKMFSPLPVLYVTAVNKKNRNT
mmetsp:Transcript_9216/g.1377  ORF Transcript_9216/g.1377 Transcript_9216/m.1377 type:complete len:83 (-) Transcript_9216:310-558(-)